MKLCISIYSGANLFIDENTDVNPEFVVWSCDFETDLCGLDLHENWVRLNSRMSANYGPQEAPFGAKGTSKADLKSYICGIFNLFYYCVCFRLLSRDEFSVQNTTYSRIHISFGRRSRMQISFRIFYTHVRQADSSCNKLLKWKIE